MVAVPTAALIQASDGNLYGTTEGQEEIGSSIFRITSRGPSPRCNFDRRTRRRQPRVHLAEGERRSSTARRSTVAPGAGTVFRLTVGGPGQS